MKLHQLQSSLIEIASDVQINTAFAIFWSQKVDVIVAIWRRLLVSQPSSLTSPVSRDTKPFSEHSHQNFATWLSWGLETYSPTAHELIPVF